MKSVLRLSVALALAGAALASPAQDATFTSRSLTTETALAAANAALQSCRKQGYQVAVAVVDRAGLVQALLRDRFAGAHTVDVAANKAWTAASFRTPGRGLQLPVARKRRIAREVAPDTRQQRVHQLAAVGRVAQLGLLFRVGDERGLDQDARDVRRLQHRKPGLLDARLVQAAHAADAGPAPRRRCAGCP
jgi:uncharacterized protein GlcG (DUF336 family)